MLTYAGRVGTGFNDRQLAEVRRTLESHRRPTPPCEGPIPPEKTTSWVEPLLVCEVEYTEWTEEGLLRQPVFLRFRDDKGVEDCVRAGGGRAGGGREGERAKGEKVGKAVVAETTGPRRARRLGGLRPRSSSPT